MKSFGTQSLLDSNFCALNFFCTRYFSDQNIFRIFRFSGYLNIFGKIDFGYQKKKMILKHYGSIFGLGNGFNIALNIWFNPTWEGVQILWIGGPPSEIKEGDIFDPMLLYSICSLVFLGVTCKKSARNLKI